MNRLTKPDSVYTSLRNIKLQQYENTGLEPKEIVKAINESREILNYTYGPLHKKVGDWLQAEQEGRLVVLPCKVGDTVWKIEQSYTEWPDVSKHYVHVGVFVLQDLPKYGRSVFMTREEAEKALEGGGADA